jgi:hypothetical protein
LIGRQNPVQSTSIEVQLADVMQASCAYLLRHSGENNVVELAATWLLLKQLVDSTVLQTRQKQLVYSALPPGGSAMVPARPPVVGIALLHRS